MRQNIDGHWYKRRFENAIRNLKADNDVSDANRQTILKFLRDLESQNVGVPRQTKYLFTLPVIAKKAVKELRGRNNRRYQDDSGRDQSVNKVQRLDKIRLQSGFEEVLQMATRLSERRNPKGSCMDHSGQQQEADPT